MNDQLPPDEDVLVLPESLRRDMHPRRGGLPGPAIEVAADAGEVMDGLVAEYAAHIESVLTAPSSDREMVGAVRAFLDGDADPLGAAAVSSIVGCKRSGSYDTQRQFTDGWIATRGLAFAACALAELSTVAWSLDELDPLDADSFRLMPSTSLQRLRALLAAAGEDEYRDAVERLAAHRRTRPQRLIVSYLVPTRHDWVDECCAEPPDREGGHSRWMLWAALGSARHVELLGGWAMDDEDFVPYSFGMRATMAEGAGPAIAPVFADALDRLSLSPIWHDSLIELMSHLPGDEAFELLLERHDRRYVRPNLLAMMERFPVRAARVLADVAARDTRTALLAAGLLNAHLNAHPELRPSVPDVPRPVPEAPADELPRLLVDPPWVRERPKKKPAVIKDLTPPAERAVVWEAGERDEWLGSRSRPLSDHAAAEHRHAAARLRAGRPLDRGGLLLFQSGPDDLVRPLLADWSEERRDLVDWPVHVDGVLRPLKMIAARFEFDAAPALTLAVRKNAANAGAVLLPFCDLDIARLMADWLLRLKSARETATAWFGRHGPMAARLLLPDSLGKAGVQRRSASWALHHIAAGHGAEGIVEAARAHGDKAADVIETLLASDPQELVPRKVPKLPGWADPAGLPQILLKDRERALPSGATRHLVTMAAMSAASGEADPGLELAREICDRRSLADFGWALFQHGDHWALTALGWLGDDETARELAPFIRFWPGDDSHARAVKGLDVLARIGTDTALAQLNGIAQKVRFKAIKARAGEKIEEVAAGLGMTGDELADRLVPDFGLGADGTMVLDYGPRRFTVGFDEQLRPYVTDEAGALRKALPKPGRTDDPEKAPAAHKRFTALKKDVRAVAANEVRRLERAMATGRRWAPENFRAYLVGHPLIWHIVRRLVWIAEDGGKKTAFRVAEDRTLSDVDDDVLTLAESARVGVAHPLHLGDGLGAWSQVLADYQILQPFPQLGRAVHALAGEEAASGRLERFEGLTVPTGRLLGLQRTGWRRGVPLDNGTERWIQRELPGGLHLVIDLDPGIQVYDATADYEQTLRHVRLAEELHDRNPAGDIGRRFGELDAVTASELLTELVDLTKEETD